MAKRKIDNNKPKVYRFMCMYVKCSGNYHMDFSSKDEALAYVESLMILRLNGVQFMNLMMFVIR